MALSGGSASKDGHGPGGLSVGDHFFHSSTSGSEASSYLPSAGRKVGSNLVQVGGTTSIKWDFVLA